MRFFICFSGINANEKGPFEWEMLKIQEEEKRWAEALKGWERDEALSR